MENLNNFQSYGNRTGKINHEKDNLLIKGNNLLALYSLLPKYRGRVKLIYIDPPYNTGNDGFKYNDKFNHSTWLVFMKNRLEVARQLLAEDGVIFVQIDDNEQAYLKVLMDEVFGRENFINHVSVKVKSSAGFKTVNKGMMEVSEYIFLYAKGKNKTELEKIFVETDYDDNYDLVVNNIEEDFSSWNFSKIEEHILYRTDDKYSKYINAKIKFLLKAEFAMKNAQRVFRYTAINNDAGAETIKAKNISLKNDKVSKVETSKGIRYIYKGQQITFYSAKIKNIHGKSVSTEQLTNIWQDIKWEGIANEGGIKLKKGKKPEALLQRIIQIATKEGDLVLDFFAGSGTTPAVAHKMGRRWIAIEQMDYIETITRTRMQKVMDGEQGGVSKNHKWTGGGGFAYFELNSNNYEI